MDRGIAPSCFTIGLDEIQDLVTDLSGTGKAETRRDGRWTGKEKVDAGRVIGFVETDHGRIETSSFKIHYSNTGTHAVPTYGGRGDEV